jgi:hypothetical protein
MQLELVVWNHGYEELQKDDSDAILFNQIAKKCRGMIGIPSLCQVICYGHTELETYYCRMCQVGLFIVFGITLLKLDLDHSLRNFYTSRINFASNELHVSKL